MPHESKSLKFAVIIPAYNEEQFIGLCLNSLLKQSLLPSKIIVVDDGSSDNTLQIIDQYAKKSKLIEGVPSVVKHDHQPGEKVIKAFYRGLDKISIDNYDVICKFDADLEFPSHYIERLNQTFTDEQKAGLCGGVCSVIENGNWQTENITNFDHVRGALKAYRVKAFKEIGGLTAQMGWDTADEFKLRYRNWQIKTDTNLNVKHYKPTGSSYEYDYYKKQGEVFYALRYGLLLTYLAALKIATQRNQKSEYKTIIKSYKKAAQKNLSHLLSKKEGKYLRKYRWKKIFSKIIS